MLSWTNKTRYVHIILLQNYFLHIFQIISSFFKDIYLAYNKLEILHIAFHTDFLQWEPSLQTKN